LASLSTPNWNRVSTSGDNSSGDKDGDGDGVDINYGPITSVGGDSYNDERYIAVKKHNTGDTSLQQETTPRGIKRNSDAVDCN
jgi:hypothetical protein